MMRYTVGTQRGAFDPLEGRIGDGLNPQQTARSTLYPLCTFKKNGGNTQWRVCHGAHTPLMRSWFRVLVHSQVHSGYTVVHSEDVAGETGEGPRRFRRSESLLCATESASARESAA